MRVVWNRRKGDRKPKWEKENVKQQERMYREDYRTRKRKGRLDREKCEYGKEREKIDIMKYNCEG